jgi:hypothetical protein
VRKYPREETQKAATKGNEDVKELKEFIKLSDAMLQ